MHTVIYDVVSSAVRGQMRSRRDSLVQLGNSRNTMSQFRLTDRHDGQQKSVIELEIYQQADLLKSLDAFNRLRVIDRKSVV